MRRVWSSVGTELARVPGGEARGAKLLLGVASLAVGYALLVAIGLLPVAAAPEAGAFTLVGLFLFFWAWADPEWGPDPATVSLARLRPVPSPARHRRAVAPPRRAVGGSEGRPTRRPAMPTVAQVAATPALSPGEALWARLTPAPAGSFPVHLIGPIAESALEALPGEEFEDLPSTGPAWGGPSFPGGEALAVPGVELPGSGPWSLTEREAFDHRPPHLRAASTEWKELRGRYVSAAPDPRPEGLQCATCRRGLTNPPAWRSCAACHRPFCGECAFRARRNLGSGRCTECASRTEIEPPRFIA